MASSKNARSGLYWSSSKTLIALRPHLMMDKDAVLDGWEVPKRWVTDYDARIGGGPQAVRHEIGNINKRHIEARRLATSLAFIACETSGPKGVTAVAIESETML